MELPRNMLSYATAVSDLGAALVLYREQRFPQAVTCAQQATEKTIKAVAYDAPTIFRDARAVSKARHTTSQLLDKVAAAGSARLALGVAFVQERAGRAALKAFADLKTLADHAGPAALDWHPGEILPAGTDPCDLPRAAFAHWLEEIAERERDARAMHHDEERLVAETCVEVEDWLLLEGGDQPLPAAAHPHIERIAQTTIFYAVYLKLLHPRLRILNFILEPHAVRARYGDEPAGLAPAVLYTKETVLVEVLPQLLTSLGVALAVIGKTLGPLGEDLSTARLF